MSGSRSEDVLVQQVRVNVVSASSCRACQGCDTWKLWRLWRASHKKSRRESLCFRHLHYCVSRISWVMSWSTVALCVVPDSTSMYWLLQQVPLGQFDILSYVQSAYTQFRRSIPACRMPGCQRRNIEPRWTKKLDFSSIMTWLLWIQCVMASFTIWEMWKLWVLTCMLEAWMLSRGERDPV